MATGPEYSDELLMAYADGELDGAERQRVAAAEAADASLASRIERFRQSRMVLTSAFRPLLAEPVPVRLLSAATGAATGQSDNVVAFGRRNVSRRWPELAMAAAVAALVAGLGMHIFDTAITKPSTGNRLAFGAPIGQPLANTLATLPSGIEQSWDGERVKAIGTFTDRDGTLCRDFEYDLLGKETYAAVACRVDDFWSLAFAVRAAPAGGDYAPASSQSALESYLAAIEAGPIMSAEEEKAALATITR